MYCSVDFKSLFIVQSYFEVSKDIIDWIFEVKSVQNICNTGISFKICEFAFKITVEQIQTKPIHQQTQ